MACTLASTCYLTILSVKHALSPGSDEKGQFGTVIIGLMATSGLYTIASLMYFDPWHIFTCFGQYLLLLPGWLCTMQVYAFCNTYVLQNKIKSYLTNLSHDVSWGTKGETKVHMELGAAIATGDGEKGEIVEVEMPSDQLDIDAGYDEALSNLRDRKAIPSQPPDVAQEQEDYYREIRTRLVLVWLIANALLAMSLSHIFDYRMGSNAYLTCKRFNNSKSIISDLYSSPPCNDVDDGCVSDDWKFIISGNGVCEFRNEAQFVKLMVYLHLFNCIVYNI